MNVPKSQRLTFALVGNTNAGKSTLLNLIAGQDVSITSAIAGTTTDVVEKVMELPPLGPVLFLDTGGWNDSTDLGQARKERTQRTLQRADILIGVVRADAPPDHTWIETATALNKPVITVITHANDKTPHASHYANMGTVLYVDATDMTQRDTFLRSFKTAISAILPPAFIHPPTLLEGLVPKGGLIVQVTPIDSQAPKGRLILPQVSTLRNALDCDYINIVITENRIHETIALLHRKPDLVICDSQVVERTVADLPPDVRCTTYSIIMARFKGDLQALINGARAIRTLKDGDRILIAEACTHHAADDDIGRIKIPNWIRKMTGKHLTFETVAGRDFPQNLQDYALVVHCGGCMINRPLMMWRIEQANAAHIPITNYGICISETQGVLERVLQPFTDGVAQQ